jgi:hypothetical protein
MSAIAVILILLVLVSIPALLLVGAMRGGAALSRLVMVLAVLVIAATSIATIAQIVALFNGGNVTLAVPVQPVEVKVPAGVKLEIPPVATFASANFQQVQVVAHGFSLNTSLLLAAGWLCGALTIIAICIVVLRLSRGLAAADPFGVGATALSALAWIVLVGWTAATVLGELGAAGASWDLFWVAGYTLPEGWTDGLDGHGWPSAGGGGINLPLEPLGAALLLALLAAVFRHGERLRRDADGLV